MADETKLDTGAGEGGNAGTETPVNDAVLDALFDQVATADPSATSLETPESGAAAAAAEGAGGGSPVEGQSGAEGTPAPASPTPSSGSPASGAAPAASAPQASDGASPAGKPAVPTPEGAPAPAQPSASAPEKHGKITPEEENRRLKGRVAALARENDALKRNGTSTPAASSAPAPASGGPGKPPNGGSAPKSKILAKLEANPQWAQVKKDYNEIAAPIEEALGALAGEVEQTTADRHQSTLASNGEIVAKAHPDAGKIVQSKEWNAWFEHQPSYVRKTIQANGDGVHDPDACIDIFNRFKADTGFVSQAPSGGGNNAPAQPNDEAALAARAARRDGAIGGVGKGKGGETTNLPEDPDKLFDHLASQVDKSSGRKAAA